MRRAVLLAVVFVAPAARAQTSPEARAHFDTGLAAVDRGEYARALAEFEAARAIEETAKIVYNVAGCLKALQRPAAALAAYERVLALGVEGLPATNRRNVAPFIEELRARVAWLAIRTTPAEATILVDGREVDRQPVAVDPGVEVAVEARLDGYRAARTAARPGAPGPLVVTLELERIPESEPAALTVALPESAHPAAPASSAPAPRPEPAPRGKLWPWLVAGAAVVAIGAGTGLYFALQPETLTGDASVTGP